MTYLEDHSLTMEWGGPPFGAVPGGRSRGSAAQSIRTWQRGHHDAAQLLVRLHLLKRVPDLIPPFVWKDYAKVDPQ